LAAQNISIVANPVTRSQDFVSAFGGTAFGVGSVDNGWVSPIFDANPE